MLELVIVAVLAAGLYWPKRLRAPRIVSAFASIVVVIQTVCTVAAMLAVVAVQFVHSRMDGSR
jgi:hypothetical protein